MAVLLNNGTTITSYGRLLLIGVAALIADFNGDGNLDYVSTWHRCSYGLSGKGNGTFGTANSVAVSPGPVPMGPQWVISTTSGFPQLR